MKHSPLVVPHVQSDHQPLSQPLYFGIFRYLTPNLSSGSRVLYGMTLKILDRMILIDYKPQ
jgi:hypothetical protein